MGGRTACGVAAAYWGGLVLGLGGAAPDAPGLAVAAIVVLLAAGLLRRARGPLAGLAVLLAVGAAGGLRGAGEAATDERARVAVREGVPYRIVARVEGHPGRATERPLITLRLEAAEPRLPRGLRLRLRFPEGVSPEWGERFSGLAELVRPAPPRAPGGWDARTGARAAGIAAFGRMVTARRLEAPPSSAFLRATVVRWRRAVEAVLDRGAGPLAAPLLRPLVTGDRSGLPTELQADFRASGLVHLLALSGLHVGALAAVARGAAASAGAGVEGRAIAGVLAALFYGALAGPLPSLMRAATGECWLAAARILRRPADPAQSLGVSALVLLAVRPGWALDLGFQLSCAASLGLALAGAWMPPPAGGRARLGAAIGFTLAAQLACAPLLMSRVHALAWPGLLGNLVAVPLCGMLLATAWLGIGADFVATGAGRAFFAAAEPLAGLLAALTRATARWPGASLPAGHDPGPLLLAGAGVSLLALASFAPRDLASRSTRRPPGIEALAGLGLFGAALGIALALTTPEPRPPAGTCWIVALDVGQGDATAIADPGGWWLVDAGPASPRSDAGERVVNPFLRWVAVRSLRAMVLTHDDGDHTGGAAAVARAVTIRRRAGPAGQRAAGPGGIALAAGHGRLGLEGVRVLWPPRGGDAVARRSDNAGGLVLELVRGETRVLLTADVDSLVEERLPIEGPLALLKVGHHGSASSSGVAFLARARPRRAWVSAGASNAYGHPAPATIARLGAAGVEVDRVDREGSLWYEVRAAGVRRLDWRRGAPRPPAPRGNGARGPVTAARER